MERIAAEPKSRNWAKVILVAVGIGLATMVTPVLTIWLEVWLPLEFMRETVIGFFRAVMLTEIASFVVIPIATAALTIVLARSRLRGVRTPWASRLLLLAVSTLLALIGAEAVAAWVVSIQRFPVLPVSFPADHDRDAANELRIVAIGESSALGMPYEDLLSVPAIVAWQLERVFPGRKVSMNMLAKAGTILSQAHGSLANLRRRPDAILVYSGHNEFPGVFTWNRYVPYYVDQNPPGFWDWLEELGQITWLGSVAVDAIAKQRVRLPPPPRITREMIDIPGFTPRESARLLGEYARRLDAIAVYSRSIQALPILIVPVGNEADYEPNRSMLAPETRLAERVAFRGRLVEARGTESADPARAIALYQAVIDHQPGFAEAHFRLARLLARAGNFTLARRHFSVARDLDGMPQRCLSSFQEACRVVGRNRDCVLVDGPAILRKLVPDGILDDRLFHDAHHPTLVAYIALAQETLNQLHERGAFGWPEGTGVPFIDVDECAAHFGVGQTQWAEVCRRSSQWHKGSAYVRFDPSARLEKASRLRKAQREIEQGTAPEATGLAGYGPHPRLDGPPVQSGGG